MAKSVIDSVEFVQKWGEGCRNGLTVKEIADSMGVNYGACLARFNNLSKRYPELAKFTPKKGQRGRKISAEQDAEIRKLLAG